jgi:hypothetical protein
MKSSTAPARSQKSGESGFKSQMQEVIQEKKGRSGTKDPKQDDAEKKDTPKPPITVAVAQPTPPLPPVASFGLPSAGVEAGSNIAVEQAPIDTPTPETSAKLAVNPPTPPAETVQPDRKTDLAFALRLADLTPNREVPLAEAAQQPAPLTKTIQPDQKMDLTFAPQLPETPQTPQQAVLPAPTTSPQNADNAIATPIKTAQPPQPPAPIIAIMPARQGTTAEPGSHSSDGGAPGKETPKHLQPQPAADPKSFRQASASDPVSGVSRETPTQTPSPTPVAATPAPLTTPAPEPSAAIPVERVSIPLPAPNPASHVTDVSVNIQVPRADASGDDRVAIRMLQKGSEIHVSVRTPDTQLAQSLRQDLGKLTTGLDQGGFRTETWRPTAANTAAQSNTNPQHQSTPDSPNRDEAGSNAQSGGNSGQEAGEHKRKQQDDRPRWVAELEQQKNQ